MNAIQKRVEILQSKLHNDKFLNRSGVVSKIITERME